MTVFTVDVFHTDRTRNADGSFVTFRSRVDVLAADAATLVAAQLVDAIRHDSVGGMVTGTQIVL